MSELNTIFQFYLYYLEKAYLDYWLVVIGAGVFLLYFIFRLRTKRFYFIRHGQTILNKEHIKQNNKGGLTEAGKEQAERIGEYLKQYNIQKMYVSPYERTTETAEIINKSLNTSVRYSPLLVERRNPSEIVGKSYYDLEVKKIIDLIDLSYHADDMRYSDEENFNDLKKRARKCLDFLGSSFSWRIVVVTHGVFLKMLLSYILNGKDLHNSAYVRLSFFNPADNGGVTVCEYTPWKKWITAGRGWKILNYNENLTK